MTAVNPASATLVTAAFALLNASLAQGYGPGATNTHHRSLVLSWFLTATEDPRLTATDFDEEATYTKLGARGVEMALAHYTAFLHKPASVPVMLKGAGSLTDGAAYQLDAGAEAAARLMIVECVDMMLAYVGEVGYTQIWDIAVGSYTPTWADSDSDGIGDATDSPSRVSYPVLSTSGRNMTVTNGTWTGSPTAYEYVWYLDDEVIDGQIDTTYTVPNADAGSIKVRVTPSNAYGEGEPALSNALTIAAV